MCRYRRDPLTVDVVTPSGPPATTLAENPRGWVGRGLLVAAILLLALGLRVGYVGTTSFRAVNDAGTYNRLARNIAEHGDYHTGTGNDTGAGGSHGPTAYFPPAYPYLLAVADLLDGHTHGGKPALAGERYAGAVLGTLAVALLGLVALEAFGAPVALAGLLLGAIYPVFVELSGTLVAENLLVVFELAAVWTMLRARRAARPLVWIGASGILAGLSTLTHENAAVFVIPLAVAAALGLRRAGPNRVATVSRPRARQWMLGPIVFLLATAAMIAPWTIRNAVELHHFVPVADETGITLRGTYNPASAAFAPLPYKWRFYWDIPGDADLHRRARHESEIPLSDQIESRALHYIAAHPTAPLTVAWSNLRRMVDLRGTYAWHQSSLAIGLHVSDAHVGVIAFYVLALLAIAGAFTAAARRAPPWLWALPVLYGLSIVFINVETPRFREPIDPFVVLLAACALTRAVAYLRSRIRFIASRPATL